MTSALDHVSAGLWEIVERNMADGGPCWFEGLAVPLAATRWRGLQQFQSLTPDNYGTARYLAEDQGAVRDVLCRVEWPAQSNNHRPIIVEALPEEVRTRYERLGLTLYKAEDVHPALISRRFGEALRRISMVAELGRSIGQFLAALHVLKPPGPDYDISYSDPSVPFSIFVSLDTHPQEHSSLRLAEAIVHECMHLQLTLIEDLEPLVRAEHESYHSPWRGTHRPVRGILHGLYVFRVIHDFLDAFPRHQIYCTGDRKHIEMRLSSIRDEISSIAGFEHSTDLTRSGRQLATHLLRLPVR